MVGLFVMLLSMIFIGMVGNLQQFFMFICVFYIGLVIVELVCEMFSVLFVDVRVWGSYMGFSCLGLVIGGVIGYIGGGWLFDMGKVFMQFELLWMMFGIIGFIIFLVLGW